MGEMGEKEANDGTVLRRMTSRESTINRIQTETGGQKNVCVQHKYEVIPENRSSAIKPVMNERLKKEINPNINVSMDAHVFDFAK